MLALAQQQARGASTAENTHTHTEAGLWGRAADGSSMRRRYSDKPGPCVCDAWKPHRHTQHAAAHPTHRVITTSYSGFLHNERLWLGEAAGQVKPHH